MDLKAYEIFQRANRCGPVPVMRDWRNGVSISELTRAERMMTFMEHYLRVPEGARVGKRLKLAFFQEAFIYCVYDNPHVTRQAILSMARKNGKTALTSGLLLGHVVGPEAARNTQLVSGAMSREQAALVFHLAEKMVRQSVDLSNICKIIPSSKRIIGSVKNSEYKALSADASTAHGLSPKLAILDEIGQVKGPTSSFIDAIQTGQGAHEHPLIISISTSAPSDADMFSQWCDDAETSGDQHTVCHVYEADEGCDLLDEEQWAFANPALEVFRSKKDLEEQLKRADRLPSAESTARNLLLNQRVSLESLWIPPSLWKNGARPINLEAFQENPCAVGLDLSARNDLTAAVFACSDANGDVQLLPFVFTPSKGLEERSKRDRTPYDLWVKQGKMIAVAGSTVDYHQVAEFLQHKVLELGIWLESIEFDRWRIEIFMKAAEECGFGEELIWSPVGQGYKDFSPRCEAFEALLLSTRLIHGGHPLLTMAASNAISVRDPAGNIKLSKKSSTLRIDPIVAAVMSAYAVSEGDGLADNSMYNSASSSEMIM